MATKKRPIGLLKIEVQLEITEEDLEGIRKFSLYGKTKKEKREG